MSDDKKPQSPWGRPGGKKSGSSSSGQKGKSPWGKPTGPRPVNTKPTQGSKGPDLEKFFPGLKARGGSGGGGGGPRGQRPAFPKGLLFLGAAALILFSSVYTVQGNEQAAVLRFGDYVRTAGPGLNFKLPYPIETKIVEKVTEQQEINVGAGNSNESLMITGDENIVDLEFTVLFIINDLGDYLFEVEDPKELVQATAESVVREIVGMNELDDIITTQRAPLIAAVTQQLQGLLDEYQAGVQIIDVQFQKTDPPKGAVQDAFDQVVASEQQAEADVNSARANFNKITLEAEGRAAAILEEAEGYRDRVIAISEGEAERFLKVYDEYRKAPEVTRRRIYLETMEEVYARGDKVILDGEAGGGAVPYLPLNELNRGGNP